MWLSTGKNKLSQEDIAYLFNALRQATVKWSGRAECLKLARKKTFVRYAKKSGKPVFKYKWQCAVCERWSGNEADMEVDHKVEIGGVGGFTGDWNETISKIFPRPVSEHLQALCIVCHNRKTNNYMNAGKQWERKSR